MKWLYFPFFDHHIAISEYTAEELRSAAAGQMVPRNVWIRPLGVDLRVFSPAQRTRDARCTLEQRIHASANTAIILYSGRLAPEKNLTLLFYSFAHLVERAKRIYRLVIAGDGIERTKWERFCAARVPGQVLFLGHIKSKHELAGLLANADAFIHPNAHEPFGIAPLEAMASGLPVIVPNSGGVCSYANLENAWIAEPDSASVSSAVESLLDQPSEAARRMRNALQKAARFSWPSVAASFLDLYAVLHQASAATGNAPVVLPAPAFTSTPARGFSLAFSRGASHSAEAAFRLFSRL
jgi:glycosyltransferase involved in cell wall biosynthesis